MKYYFLPLKNILKVSLVLLDANDKIKAKLAVICISFTVLTFAYNLDDDSKKSFHIMVEEFVGSWISKRSVIGGSMFGGSWNSYLKKLDKEVPEFKVI